MTKSVYNFMRDHQREHGYPPTQREIMAGLRMSSQTVIDRLQALESVGAIERKRYAPRGAYIPSEPNQFRR